MDVTERRFGIHIVTDVQQRPEFGEAYQVTFENSYGASIIRSPFSYGGKDNLYEIGVLHNNHLCYDTHITNDVIGYLTEQEVTSYLDQIAQLPCKCQ